MVNTPGLGGFTSGNGGGSGQQGTGRFPGQGGSSAPSQGGVSAQTQEILRQQQAQTNGLDFYALSQISGVSSYQEPIPPLDFQWTWQSSKQAGFKFTINSFRGGLEMQRGRIQSAHTRLAESSLVTHSHDMAVLPFATVQQTNLQTLFPANRLLHANYGGRTYLAPSFSTSGAFFAEQSISDPTVVPISAGLSSVLLEAMGTVMVSGVQHLVVLTGQGMFFYSGPNLAAQGVPSWLPVDKDGFQYIPNSFVQSPLPGNPLIMRSSRSIILVPTETTATNGNPYTQTASLMLKGAGLPQAWAIGFQRVGNLQPAGYFLEWDAVNGRMITQVSSVNAYGTQYQVHHLSLNRLVGAAANPERGAIAFTDGYRVVDWSGRETDLQIFNDPFVNPGYREFCFGLRVKEGQLFAHINELPYSTGYVSQGRIRACERRYDYDLKQWHQVSEWVTFTQNGFISWEYGIPVAASQTPGQDGYLSAMGTPDLPFGDITRAMHNYATLNPVSASAPLTWFHKFQEPAGTNPYSLRGLDQPFALTGAGRSSAFIFPSGYEYADKYIDAVEWGGQDTGGTGSVITVRIGEGGRMDLTNPGPLAAVFTSPISHSSRWHPFNNNETALLFPQIEVELTRGIANLTPQGLPITIHGHVDLREQQPRHGWRPWGRSKG